MSLPVWAKDSRDLNAKCTITFADSRTLILRAAQITSLTINDTISNSGLGIGSANSVAYAMTFYNPDKQYHPSDFDGASVVTALGIHGTSSYNYTTIGTWYVTDVDFSEQSTVITLHGSDAIGVLLEEDYEDSEGMYPATLSTMLTRIAQATGVTLKSTTFLNSTERVETMPDGWDSGVSYRTILADIAACAGGYAHMTTDNKLEIKTFGSGRSYDMTPHYYKEFSMTGGNTFTFNCLQVKYVDDEDDEYTRYPVDPDIEDDSTNTIQIDNNPLMNEAMAEAIVEAFEDLPSLESCSVEWGGDPSVKVGDTYSIQDLALATHTMMVLSQRFTFSGGLSVSESGEMPSTRESSDSYSASVSVLNKDGTVNYKAIAGLTKRVIVIDNDWAETHYMPLVDADGVKIEDGKVTVESTGEILMQSNSALHLQTGAQANLITLDNNGITLGSGGKLQISMNNFTINADGDVTMTGTVVAAAGSVGGWTLTQNMLYSGLGANCVCLSSDGTNTYAIWAGAESADSAPFRVSRDGTVNMTNIAWVNKDGVAQPGLNLRTNAWKLQRAVSEMGVDTATNTLTIKLFDNTTVNFSKATDVSVSGAWANNTYTATATCGTETAECSTTIDSLVGSNIGYTVSGNVVFLTGSIGLYDDDSTQIASVGVGGAGSSGTIVITSMYNDIRSTALAGVTLNKSWSNGTLTVGNSANSKTKTATISQDTSSASATYNSSTKRYSVVIPLTDTVEGSSIGTSALYSFAAQDAYNAGWAAAVAMCSASRSGNVITVKQPSATPDVAASDITYTITAYAGNISAVSWPGAYSVVAKVTANAQVNGTSVNAHTRQTTLSK